MKEERRKEEGNKKEIRKKEEPRKRGGNERMRKRRKTRRRIRREKGKRERKRRGETNPVGGSQPGAATKPQEHRFFMVAELFPTTTSSKAPHWASTNWSKELKSLKL